MKIAIVVIRYGLEVMGGIELHARLVAERLMKHMQVDVLTTCAVEMNTWANHYPAGMTMLNGVPVRRFAVAETRDMAEFGRYSAQVAHGAHTIYDEVEWMRRQGPHSPMLTQYIRDHSADYDYFIFCSYLYATTYAGLPLVAHKSILLPTAHDEPWLYFDIFRSIFQLPRGFYFNTPEEEQLVRRVFNNAQIPGVVVGVGIEIPTLQPTQVTLDDYILFMGRADEGKGCDELFRYFLRYKELTHDPVKLALIGTQAMPIPAHPDIVALGFMGDERFTWLSRAQLLVLPSRYESLSMVTLEAWRLGVTTLVNGASEVLKGHCQRGNGGLYYESEAEFIEALKVLRQQPGLRAQLGRQGQAYVRQRYNWECVEAGYLDFLQHL